MGNDPSIKELSLNKLNPRSKKIVEFSLAAFVTILLVSLSRVEARLYRLSESLSIDSDFFASVIYFGIINLNVILILILTFIILRNVAKLVLERRRGVIGSKLKTKLVVTFLLFSLLPTLLIFHISNKFINTNIDQWFSEKVRNTMQRTQEAGAQTYRQDQKRLENIAKLAVDKIELETSDDIFDPSIPKIKSDRLRDFIKSFGIERVIVFSYHGDVLDAYTHTKKDIKNEHDELSNLYAIEAIYKFRGDPRPDSMSMLTALEDKDIVRGIAPIVNPITNHVIGVVVVEENFETSIMRSIESILKEFSELKPQAELIKTSFIVLLVVMTVLIIFAAMWLGFYAARNISEPIQLISEATGLIASGQYGVKLPQGTDDEIGKLTNSFNRMAKDLDQKNREVVRSQNDLLKINHDVVQQRHYMEVVLKSIANGVIAINKNYEITALNEGAENFLSVKSSEALGRKLPLLISPKLYESFWIYFSEQMKYQGIYKGQIQIQEGEIEKTYILQGTKIRDGKMNEYGIVIVIEDATEQVKLQKVAAWREVARRLAHEIKNPITPIRLNAERLLRKYEHLMQGKDKEIFATCLKTILSQVDSLKDLVNEFSKFARLPKGQPVLSDLNQIIRNVVDLYKNSYTDIHIDAELLRQIPKIRVDPEELNRAFVNIVTNAIHALTEQNTGSNIPKSISFKTEFLQDIQTIRVEVCDTGCGIPDEIKDKVVLPYYSTKKEGTGLGLAMVQQIVTDHGGYLRLQNNEPRGTKVIIELPLDYYSGMITSSRNMLHEGRV